MAPSARLVFVGFLVSLVSAATIASEPVDKDRIVKAIAFAMGSSSAVIKGELKGSQYVDHQLRAGAGQQLVVSMKASNGANYFNILPPGSRDVGMFNGSIGDNRFDGLLPDDGVYTVRVYLMRSAARRNETSKYTVNVSVSGTSLKPVSATADALVPGTRFHATSTAKCTPPYATTPSECEIGVVRRGFDGTATVELRWGESGAVQSKRRILFIKGKPSAADASIPFTFTRDERGYSVVFEGEARFEIPEPMVFGG